MSKVTRDIIVEAAVELFAKTGYKGTSMRDIARAVGIRKASLYHHFESKQEILLTILDMGLERLIAPLEEVVASETSAEAKLRAAIQHHATLIATNPGVATLFFYEDYALDDGLRDHYVRRRDEFEAIFRRILQEGMDAGVFRRSDVSISAHALLGMVNWSTRWYRPQGRLSIEEIAQSFADLFLFGQLVVDEITDAQHST